MIKEHIAYPLARAILLALYPDCVRVDFAGSLRRGKETPGDIEIVCIPSQREYTVSDMFDPEAKTVVALSCLDEALAELYQRGEWMLALNPVGKPLRNGPRQKKLAHIDTGILLDLFITDARRWAYTFVIRTGPKEFRHALVTRAHGIGMFFSDCLLHNHPPAFETVNGKRETQPCPAGDTCPKIIELVDEQDFFAALHLAVSEPAARSSIDPYSIMRV